MATKEEVNGSRKICRETFFWPLSKITAKCKTKKPWCPRPNREGGCSLGTQRDTTKRTEHNPRTQKRVKQLCAEARQSCNRKVATILWLEGCQESDKVAEKDSRKVSETLWLESLWAEGSCSKDCGWKFPVRLLGNKLLLKGSSQGCSQRSLERLQLKVLEKVAGKLLMKVATSEIRLQTTFERLLLESCREKLTEIRLLTMLQQIRLLLESSWQGCSVIRLLRVWGTMGKQ